MQRNSKNREGQMNYLALYTGDYLRDTADLSLEEHGAYLLLLFATWDTGPLLDDDRRLARILRVDVGEWLKMRPSIQRFWTVADGKWVNARIERERQRTAEIKEKYSARGKAGAKGRWGAGTGDLFDASSNATGNASSNAYDMLGTCPTNTNTNTNTITSKTRELADARSSSPVAANGAAYDDQPPCGNPEDTAVEPVQNPARVDRVNYQGVIDLYHEILCPPLDTVKLVTPHRKAAIRARWHEVMPDLAEWKAFFEHVKRSDFLMGRVAPMGDRKPFRADLDWIIGPKNFTKIVEGKYHH